MLNDKKYTQFIASQSFNTILLEYGTSRILDLYTLAYTRHAVQADK